MGKPTLLITGTEGLIAGILIPHVSDAFEIRGLDKLQPPANPSFRRADIRHEAEVRAVFEEFSPRYVLHLAANPHVDSAWEPVLESNIHGTWNVFSLAHEYHVKRVVFASSNHATGYYEGIPPTLHQRADRPVIDVNDPVRPDGPYGISKIAGEAIARYFHDRHDLEVVCLRIGSVLPDDDPTRESRHRSTWLSHRDLRHLVRRALLADQAFPGFGIYYGVSRNSQGFWDISNAETELGFQPADDASTL